jgi:hypothetical protein
MLSYLALGLAALGLLYLAARWFVSTPTRQLAQALTTFAAVFSAMASTGLLLTGRLGLAIVTVAATVMAVRALVQGPRGATPLGGGRPGGGPASSVDTRYLAMQLDHATGEVDGLVQQGAFRGRELSSLGLSELRALLQEIQLEDPQSVSLIEAYLDRRAPGWRETGSPPSSPGGSAMDERTALEILGLSQGASEAEIKAAHRALMARCHPDHGGSAYLAAQLNQARDFLLRPRR